MLDFNINIGNTEFSFQRMGLALPAACRKIARSLCRQYKHYKTDEAVTFDRLVDDYFSGRTSSGSIVSTTGLLSKYVLSPRTIFDTKFGRNIEEIKRTYDPIKNVTDVSFTISPTQGQYPVQTIKPIYSNEELHIYFLYPPDIQSFHLNQCELDKLEFVEKEFLIPRNSRPILVISPKALDENLHRQIRITGSLNTIEDSITAAVSATLSSSSMLVLGNTINPFCEVASSLCIDLRDSAELSVMGDVRELPAQLYVEAHFESDSSPILNVGQYTAEMTETNWIDMGFGDGISWGIRNSKITIATTKNFERFCYMVPTILSNRQSYELSVSTLHSEVESFRKQVQKIAGERNTRIRHKYDFIFDHEKARLFHPDGFLRSAEVELFLKKQPQMADDVEWLRSRT